MYADTGPKESVYPLVVFQLTDEGEDVTVHNEIRILVDVIYMVKAIVEGRSYDDASAIANRIDAVLHHTTGAVTGGVIESCTRDRLIRYSELASDGREYRHLGGEFRIQARST